MLSHLKTKQLRKIFLIRRQDHLGRDEPRVCGPEVPGVPVRVPGPGVRDEDGEQQDPGNTCLSLVNTLNTLLSLVNTQGASGQSGQHASLASSAPLGSKWNTEEKLEGDFSKWNTEEQ